MPYSFAESDPCKCIRCGACGGTGRIRDNDAFDAHELEPCDECGGDGIVETCDRCRFLIEQDHE